MSQARSQRKARHWRVTIAGRLGCQRQLKTAVLLIILFLGMTGPFSRAQPATGAEATAAQKQMVARLSGWSDSGGQTVPFSRSTPEERNTAALYLVEALSELGLSPTLHRYSMPNINGLVDLLLPPYRGTNVYVEVPATIRTKQTVILGAHYDSDFLSPGAVDNASGVALVWAVAGQVAAMDTRALNFIFVFFDQEEDDEVGSRAFARFLQQQKIDVHSVHISDLAGWDEGGDGMVQIQSPTPELERLYRNVAAGLGIPLELVGGASSDNKSFLAAAMPTVGVFQPEIHPQLHRPSDTYEIVDFYYLQTMTELVGEAMQALALQGAH